MTERGMMSRSIVIIVVEMEKVSCIQESHEINELNTAMKISHRQHGGGYCVDLLDTCSLLVLLVLLRNVLDLGAICA